MIKDTIEIKDYDNDVHKLKTVLNMVGFPLDYKHTDLLWRTLDLYQIKEDDFSIQDAIDTKIDWEKHWNDYHLNKGRKENRNWKTDKSVIKTKNNGRNKRS